MAFEQLKEKLKAEGLFDPAASANSRFAEKDRDRHLAHRRAVVDILRTLERRFAKLHVLIYPARRPGRRGRR